MNDKHRSSTSIWDFVSITLATKGLFEVSSQFLLFPEDVLTSNDVRIRWMFSWRRGWSFKTDFAALLISVPSCDAFTHNNFWTNHFLLLPAGAHLSEYLNNHYCIKTFYFHSFCGFQLFSYICHYYTRHKNSRISSSFILLLLGAI